MFHRLLTGLDIHEPNNILVENQTGATLSALKVVSLDGFGSARPKVKLCLAPPTDKAFGIVVSDILNTAPNNFGYISSLGFLYNVNTNAFNAGDILYSNASADLTTTVSGNPIAYVTKKDATTGILFVFGLSAFIDPETNSWGLTGNAGLGDALNFIGTTDNVDFRIRTNNLLTAIFSKNNRFALGPDLTNPDSHFHQKSHTGYSGSGLRQETFALKTESSTPQNIIVIPIADLSSVRVEFTVSCRYADGTNRASFKRSGLFYRESSNVQIEDKWQSDHTVRSNPGINVSYVLGVNTLTIRVKSHNSDPVFWTGHVKIEALASDV